MTIPDTPQSTEGDVLHFAVWTGWTVPDYAFDDYTFTLLLIRVSINEAPNRDDSDPAEIATVVLGIFAELIARTRMEIGDAGNTFQESFVSQGPKTRYVLSHAPVDAPSLSVFLDGVDITDNVPGEGVQVEESTGTLIFDLLPAEGAVITAAGTSYRFLTDDELTQICNESVLMHTKDRVDINGRPITLETLPPIETTAVSCSDGWAGGISLTVGWTVRRVRFTNINGHKCGTFGSHGATVEDCVWDNLGNNEDPAYPATSGERDQIGGGAGVTDLTIRRCYFDPSCVGSGIDLTQGRRVLIEDCRIHAFSLIFEGINDFMVRGNYIGLLGAEGGGGNINIENNSTIDCKFGGVAIIGNTAGAKTMKDTIIHNRCQNVIAGTAGLGDEWNSGAGMFQPFGVAIMIGTGDVIFGNSVPYPWVWCRTSRVRCGSSSIGGGCRRPRPISIPCTTWVTPTAVACGSPR